MCRGLFAPAAVSCAGRGAGRGALGSSDQVVHDASCHAVEVWTVRDPVRRGSYMVAAMPLPRLDMLANSGFVLISRPHAALTGRDPLAQALSDVVTPRVVADVEALVRRRQT